jgi:hypothetical protein
VKDIPEAAAVVGALARLRLIADENDGPWKGAALTAFEVVEASHEEARRLLERVAAIDTLGRAPRTGQRYCRECGAVQLQRHDEEPRESHKDDCLVWRARRWSGHE